MIAIVPLAGPDFDHPALPTLKPMLPIDGVPLVERAIASRRWWRSGELKPSDIIFVLRRTGRTDAFARHLAETYPGCRMVILSDLTQGALLSVLAGAAVVQDLAAPLVIDLIDVLYDSATDLRVDEQFSRPDGPDAIVPVFPSADPAYSYAAIDSGHRAGTRIRRTAEKEVISGWASAGTYIFRNTAVFLAAAGCALVRREANPVNGAWFVCPVINDLIALGYEARIEKVRLVESVSVRLKEMMQPRTAVPA
ncbi:MAG TPA: hypothetical protein VM118_11905 [Acidobacteriota bacterium]|nr:hypothetical protein [Acidobacteriota bacterium]